jgi:hypothetical protein
MRPVSLSLVAAGAVAVGIDALGTFPVRAFATLPEPRP